MPRFLKRIALYVLAQVLILLLLGCSTGDLSRSDAKKKISQTLDMCNPCFLAEFGGYAFAAKLMQSGYLDHNMQLTPQGRTVLGENSIIPDPSHVQGTFLVAAFKKEIDEVTGIALGQPDAGTAQVQFTYRIVPLLDFLRDDPPMAIAVLGRNGSEHLQRIGSIEQKDGKFIAFHASGEAKFRKYDDGWRLEHHSAYGNKLLLRILPLGGFDRSIAEGRL